MMSKLLCAGVLLVSALNVQAANTLGAHAQFKQELEELRGLTNCDDPQYQNWKAHLDNGEEMTPEDLAILMKQKEWLSPENAQIRKQVLEQHEKMKCEPDAYEEWRYVAKYGPKEGAPTALLETITNAANHYVAIAKEKAATQGMQLKPDMQTPPSLAEIKSYLHELAELWRQDKKNKSDKAVQQINEKRASRMKSALQAMAPEELHDIISEKVNNGHKSRDIFRFTHHRRKFLKACGLIKSEPVAKPVKAPVKSTYQESATDKATRLRRKNMTKAEIFEEIRKGFGPSVFEKH